MKRSLLKACTAWVAAASFLQPALVAPAYAAAATEPAITLAPTFTNGGTSAGSLSGRSPSAMTALTPAAKLALLQQKIKYVFVLFQENRAFDSFFGTYPGANGIFATYAGASPTDVYAQPAATISGGVATPTVPPVAGYGYGYPSPIVNDAADVANGAPAVGTITPFLNPRQITISPSAAVNPGGTQLLYPESLAQSSHSHSGYMNDYDFTDAAKTQALNDGYALTNGGGYAVHNGVVTPTSVPSLATKQGGEVTMSHIDCDTLPYYWNWADQFTLFDNFHQTATGPSTPNAVALIAAQVGATQWVKHPAEGDPAGLTLPILTDSIPFPGSTGDVTPTGATRAPTGFDDAASDNINYPTNFASNATSQVPLTFATIPLSLAGSQIGTLVHGDYHPATDFADVSHDLVAIAGHNPNVDWGWYEEGFGPEPFDDTAITSDNHAFTAAPVHASYVEHHNGPQYFGYLGDNSVGLAHQHSLGQFYADVSNQALSPNGGVYYVRGGYYNDHCNGVAATGTGGVTGCQLPLDPNTAVQKAFPGNDDHPAYSDAQISEQVVADSVNAIASSAYWPESVIIISYDETDGGYDHVPPNVRNFGPDHLPMSGGSRIPTIVISPYSAAHTVSHVYSEHGSIVRFIDELYGLIPLASLPDEAAAQATAQTAAFNTANPQFAAPGTGAPQPALSPSDDGVTVGDLTEAFDNDRLLGNIAPIPASAAMIASAAETLPQYAGAGCTALHITPTDYPNGYAIGAEIDPPPADFNPRPGTSAGNPYLNTGTGPGGAWQH